MDKKLLKIQANNGTYEIRNETHEGKDYLVVPVVMMVEGVHNGSRGPILHTAEELGKFPESYDGRPITIDHPQDENQNFVSANSPQVIESVVVGQVFNTKMEDGKLKAEAWIELNKIMEVSPEALSYIRSNGELDVSLGLFSEEEPVSGEWNGESYIAIARNNRPDHLALLPGGVGACSWQDGCGVRANSAKTQKGGTKMPENNGFVKTIKDLNKQGYSINSIISLNEDMSYEDTLDALRTVIDRMDTDNVYHYVVDVYEDYLVYMKRDRNSGDSGLYKQDYSLKEDGSIELAGNSVKVRRKVEYTEIQNNGIKRTKFNNNNEKEVNKMPNVNSDGKCKPCEEKVNALIANAATKWTEEDRSWLSEQSEETLAKLAPVEEKKQPQANATEDGKQKEKETNPAQISKEQAIEVLRENSNSAENWLQFVPSEYRDTFQSGLHLHNEKRQGMISQIVANANGAYTAEELAGKGMVELQKLHKALVKEVSSYAGQSFADINVNEDLPEPMGITGSKDE